MRRQHGFALMLVIWSLVLLTSLATGFVYAIRSETRAATDLTVRAQSEAATEAGLRIAVLSLVEPDPEIRWKADGETHRILWDNAVIHIKVQSESGRIDINRAPEPILLGLLQQFFEESDAIAMTAALIDWRDRDDEPVDHGAERDAYERAELNYGPTNRPFVSVHELSQVLGFTRDTMETLAPYLTVHSRQSRIHAASADSVVLAAIPGIEPDDAMAFVAYREQALANDERLRFDELNEGRRYLDTRPTQQVFSLDLEIRVADGATRREHVVVRINPARGFSILTRDYLPASVPAETTAS